MIGQIVMMGVHGTDVNEDILYMLHHFHFWGSILFDRNMESVEQVSRFVKNLQSKCEEKVPLFIAVDEEGGEVVQMEEALTPPPSQIDIGNTGDTSLAENWAKKTVSEIKAMGINVNLAPVADIGFPDTYSYGSEPGIVTDFVRSAANG